MAGAGGEAKQRLHLIRMRHPGLDRILRTQEHYGGVFGSQQAGAATYFGFLSVFPILSLAVFVVGIASRVYDDARDVLAQVVNDVMPGLIGPEDGQLSLDSVERFTGWAAVVGVLGVLYAGLGWLSGLRNALAVVFERPQEKKPNFILGKLRDLVTLAVLGTIMVVAVATTGMAQWMTTVILGWLHLGDEFAWLVALLSILLGVLANTVLFFALFKLPAGVDIPATALWQGAVLGGVAFEILKQAATFLVELTRGQPAFQAFGIALVLVVWINYTSKAILYGASFAHVAPAARERRLANYEAPPMQGPKLPPFTVDDDGQATVIAPGPHPAVGPVAFLLGVGSTLLGVLLSGRKRR